MTNAELDRWIAENVMGWVLWPSAESLAMGPTWRGPDGMVYRMDRDWHPTANIAQAIDAAEKARLGNRVQGWRLLSPLMHPSCPEPRFLAAFEPMMSTERSEDAPEALCRALHDALREDA